MELTWHTTEAARRGLQEIEHTMSGGELFASYLEQLRGTGQAQCTTVWTKTTIAYRCRTCQKNDSSAICVSCFQAGDHRHHDYVMYHSDSGGCCDCGDPAAWKESGFCRDHSTCLTHKELSIPDHLRDVTCQAVQFVLKELSLWVDMIVEAKRLDRALSIFSFEVKMAETYLIWLQKVCSVSALRTIICEELTCVRRSKDDSIQNAGCILDTLLSSYARMPESLMEAETTLFLQMLYDQQFKDTFSRALMRHYAAMILPAATVPGLLADYKTLDQSLDRVMVQLFNVPDITLNLIQTDHLLECVTSVFSSILDHCTKKNVGSVDADHPAIKGKVYGRPQGDLKLIIAHEAVALHVLKERPDVFQTILCIWSLLQWMNPYAQTETPDFAERVSSAITLEVNAMAIAFGLIGRCFSAFPGSEDAVRSALVSAACLTMTSLREFLAKVKILHGSQETYSIHIPLHRTLCVIISKLVLIPWEDTIDGFLANLQPAFTESEVLDLMDHPLRVIVWMAQIRAKLWRNNPEDISGLEHIYRGSIWHAQSMDMDILMLQFCSVARANIEQSVIVRIAQRFDLVDMVTTPIDVGDLNRQLSSTKVSMLKDFLQLVLLIVRERRNTGMSEQETLRSDVIQWLCVRDHTYSQLAFTLSGILVEESKLNCVLEEVAIYNVPKLQERGFYQLKPEYWKEFDPLFAHFDLNDLEEAQERALSVGKLPHYWRLQPPREAKPPFRRLIRILHTQACHHLIWNVLHSVTTLIRDEVTATSAEALGVMALQILGMALTDLRDGAVKKGDSAMTSFQILQMRSSMQPPNDLANFIYKKPNINSGAFDWDQQASSSFPSVYEILNHLHKVKDSFRLVDSVDHVLHLISSYSLINCTFESSRPQVLDSTVDDERHKLKKQRQEAILADFAARQKAFLEQVVFEDESMERQDSLSIGAEEDAVWPTCKPVQSPALVSSEDNSSPKAAYCSRERHECAFCRSQCDGNESYPTGWIALVQRYNLPSLMHSKGEVLNSVKEVASLVLDTQSEHEGIQLPDMITVVSGCSEDEALACGSLDLHATGHVRCCGHQMHQMCFQRYAESLIRRHYAGSPYEGKGIIDLGKLDFLCPICRRLANVLLPDVNKVVPWGSLRTTERQLWRGECIEEPLQIDRGGGVGLCNLEDLFRNGSSELPDIQYWKHYWHTNENLAGAVRTFASQCLRVRKAFLKEPPELEGFPLCQILWETFAENIIHCEVGTREDCPMFKDGASSSYVSSSSEEGLLWRSDAAHGRALIELGKLALLANTIPFADKKQKRLLLLEWIGFEEVIMQKLKDDSIMGFSESCSSDKLLATSDDEQVQHCQSKHGDPVDFALDSLEMGIGEESFIKRWEGPQANEVPWDNMSKITRGKLKAEDPKNLSADLKDIGSRSLYRDKDQQNVVEVTERTNIGWLWNNDSWLSKCGVLTSGDPFELLIMLLVTVEGWPTLQELMTMVRVAYVLAATQASAAFDNLRGHEGDNSLNLKDKVVQVACLPFLRRVVLLVQILTGWSLDREGSGLDFASMDFLSLQEWLNLPIIQEAVKLGLHGMNGVKSARQWQGSPLTSFLYRTPRQARLTKLPEIFQELVLQNLKVSCSNCHRLPREPAICLVCGNIFCCGTECCKSNGLGECYRHADKEGAGVGLYLLMRSTQLVLLRSNRVCTAPSLYLDLHGEEDAYLRRGHPLHLSHLRLNEIRRLWVTAGFDHETHILHKSQIGGKVL